MKNILFVLAVAFALLMSGCAQSAQQPAAAQPVKKAPAPPAAPAAPDTTRPNATASAPPALPPAAPNDTCTVSFQKDTSNIFYVSVKTSSAKTVSVVCPNGKDGQKQGSLYFCSQLDVASPAVAYLDGKECARAQFSMPSSSASGGQQCKVLLAPSRITAGGTSTVTITAYAPQEKSTLAYNCGGSEVNESVGGMVDTGKICKFDKPGTIDVYAKINGEECSHALLEVFADAKDCSVYGTALTMNKSDYVYTAQVAARGYSGGDELRYTCYGIPHAIKASTIKDTSDFVTTIECRSASGPLSQNVAVTMGGDACGEMVVAQ